MSVGAIISAVVVWAIIISGLIFCYTKIGKGGKWED